MSYFTKVSYSDTMGLDAFGRLRVVTPHTLFDSKQIYDEQPLFWDESLETGAGITSSHSTDTAATTITSTVSTAGKFTRQTFMRFNYQPGKSQYIAMTGVLDKSGGGTGVQRRIGYFDDDNGLFFEDDEGTVKVVLRTSTSGSAVDTKVAQSSWNIDPMDGTGPSGVTADWTDTQIFLIDFAWLGSGRARMSLKIDGDNWPVHEFLNANVRNVSFMSTPNLPLRYQMITTASSPASTMDCICGTIVTEGGLHHLGITRRVSTAGTHQDMATENQLYNIVSLRQKSTHPGAMIQLLNATIALVSASGTIEWVIIHDSSLGGIPSWTSLGNSGVEYSVSNTTVAAATNGYEVEGGYVATGTGANAAGFSSTALDSSIVLGTAIDGTVQSVSLAARPIDGSTNVDVEGGLSFREMP